MSTEAQASPSPNQGGSDNQCAGKQRRMAVFAALAVMLIALVTGLSVAFWPNDENRSSSNSSSNSESSAANLDPDGNATTGITGSIGVNSTDDTGVNTTENEGDGNLDIPRLQAVQQYLSGAASITPIAFFQDNNTAQYKAAQWIADEDAMQLDIPDQDSGEKDAYQFVQRYVMAVFFYALDGPNWADTFGFLSNSSVCDWNTALPDFTVPDGVDPDFWYLGVACDDDDEILRIFMVDNGLSGSLPEELGSLVTLNHLSLYNNLIQGNFPERMKNLVNLTFVNLDSNALSGSLPTWLNSWTNLEVLGLGNNTLIGGLPSLANMSSLEHVELDNNDFSGTIDAFTDTPALEVLFLESNRFSQTINASFLVKLENLRVVHLANNDFGGSFPEHFYYYEVVDLRSNKLTGSMAAVPEDDDTVALWFLSVYNNNMTGSLPTGLANLPLMHLDVSKNALTGALTDALGDNTELVHLYLSQNNFDEGPIPNLSLLPDLEVLSMAETNRNGQIDGWVSDLSELVLLDLHDNALTGAIPPELGNLDNLEVLLLNRNRLSGSIPFELSNLINAETVFLDNNALLSSEQEMEAFCANIDETNEDNFMFFSVDETVVCNAECCSLTCRAEDLDCNKVETLKKYDDEDMVSRSEYVFSEDINVRSNERRRR